jgi:hypothetical protein
MLHGHRAAQDIIQLFNMMLTDRFFGRSIIGLSRPVMVWVET